MTLRKFHAGSGLLVAAFVVVHVINHLVGLKSAVAHIAFMRTTRVVYRFPAVEVLLLLAVAFQAGSGICLVVRGWKARRGIVPWLQAGSGAYLAFFFLVHVGAVLFGRAVLHLDTNFYYAAAGFHVPPFQLFFAPYYFLAVAALFTHLGCAMYWRLQGKSQKVRLLAVGVPVVAGLIAALLIVLMLAGVFYPVRVPAKYKAVFGASEHRTELSH